MGPYQQAELGKLDQLWGDEYDLAVTSAGWVAKRIDNGRALVAANPGELHTLIAADNGLLQVSGDCDESAGIA
jgi:hypothetical protein